MANLTKTLLLFTVLAVLAVGEESFPAIEHKQVVEANHFYSDTDSSINYTIQNVEKGRSLIFVLRNKTSTEASLQVDKSPINITLRIGN
jgi:hypothetical protein